mgnify:CR=1 FL=1
MKLTAIILNHLPRKIIEPTLKSISFADKIIIIHDSNSPYDSPKSTKSVEVITKPLSSFATQRNFAIGKAKTDWVLFVDSDEIISSSLRLEIKKTIKRDDYQGYYLPRQDIILGQTLKYGETGSIKLLRLAKKSAGKFSRSVHETWNIKGRVGELTSPILHLKKEFTNPFLGKISQYGLLDSKELVSENKPFSFFRFLFFPIGKFINNYIMRRGLLDGLLGLFHAYMMSVQSLSVRVFQWQASHLPSKTAKL